MNLLLRFSPLPLIIGDCQERHHWLIIVACLCFWNEMWNNLSHVQSSLHYFLLKTAMTALRYVQVLKTINHASSLVHHLGQGPTPPPPHNPDHDSNGSMDNIYTVFEKYTSNKWPKTSSKSYQNFNGVSMWDPGEQRGGRQGDWVATCNDFRGSRVGWIRWHVRWMTQNTAVNTLQSKQWNKTGTEILQRFCFLSESTGFRLKWDRTRWDSNEDILPLHLIIFLFPFQNCFCDNHWGILDIADPPTCTHTCKHTRAQSKNGLLPDLLLTILTW